MFGLGPMLSQMKIQLVASSFPFVKLIAEYDRFHFLWQQADKLAVERDLNRVQAAAKPLSHVEQVHFLKPSRTLGGS